MPGDLPDDVASDIQQAHEAHARAELQRQTEVQEAATAMAARFLGIAPELIDQRALSTYTGRTEDAVRASEDALIRGHQQPYSSGCQHVYVADGLRYVDCVDPAYSTPTRARARSYFKVWRCAGCLAVRVDEVSALRTGFLLDFNESRRPPEHGAQESTDDERDAIDAFLRARSERGL